MSVGLLNVMPATLPPNCGGVRYNHAGRHGLPLFRDTRIVGNAARRITLQKGVVCRDSYTSVV
jgi:hypothetical protein